jgi:hypothetical protein
MSRLRQSRQSAPVMLCTLAQTSILRGICAAPVCADYSDWRTGADGGLSAKGYAYATPFAPVTGCQFWEGRKKEPRRCVAAIRLHGRGPAAALGRLPSALPGLSPGLNCQASDIVMLSAFNHQPVKQTTSAKLYPGTIVRDGLYE